MSQIYVMVPGSSDPQLLAAEEVARRIKAGELPDSAQVVKPGESAWVAAKDFPAVAEALAAEPPAAPIGTPPPGQVLPSGAMPSLPAAEPLPTGAVAPLAPPSEVGAARPPGLPKSAMIGIGAGAGLFVVLLVSWLVWRNVYSRGLVLEHIPEDCAVAGYVDVEGIATSDPVKPALEKFFKNAHDLAEDEVGNKSKKDKERMQQVLDALEKHGIGKTSVRELAACVPRAEEDDDKKFGSKEAFDKLVIVVGGTFRKGNVLEAMKEVGGIVMKNEEACKIEDDDGLALLKCSLGDKGSKKEPFYAALVESRVLVISPDKRMLKKVRKNKDRAKEYGADKGEHFVYYRSKDAPSWSDGSFGTFKLKAGSKDVVITIETHYDPDKGKKKLDQFKDADELAKKKEKALREASEKCFEKSPIDSLGDGVEKGKVDVFDDGIKYELKFSNKDVQKAFKVLADADKKDLGSIVELPWCVWKTLEPYTF